MELYHQGSMDGLSLRLQAGNKIRDDAFTTGVFDHGLCLWLQHFRHKFSKLRAMARYLQIQFLEDSQRISDMANGIVSKTCDLREPKCACGVCR